MRFEDGGWTYEQFVSSRNWSFLKPAQSFIHFPRHTARRCFANVERTPWAGSFPGMNIMHALNNKNNKTEAAQEQPNPSPLLLTRCLLLHIQSSRHFVATAARGRHAKNTRTTPLPPDQPTHRVRLQRRMSQTTLLPHRCLSPHHCPPS